jgi:Ran GTPase-activating protein (RanGAP) involved in mRNA processing and transport
MNNLQYLDVSKNNVLQEGASFLKDVICSHTKLVFLNMGHCEMDLDSLYLILDGCEVTRQMQSLVVESTVASSVGGMNSIERHLRSGSLCLLNIKFHDRDNVGKFMQRICSYMARNYVEWKNIELVKNNKLHRLELPKALESIVCSPDGVKNMYKLLIVDHNHLLDLFKVKED